MYLNEQAEFAKLLKDLCTSTDRPFDKDLVGVFWEDLKDVPLQAIQRQAAQLRAKGTKRFSSNDLRPPPSDDAGPLVGYDNHVIIGKIYDHVLRTLWSRMSPLQRLYKHSFVFTRDKAAPRCVAMKIDPDQLEVMIDGELRVQHFPGHMIRLEDCDAEFAPSRENTPLASRDEEWNDADAARDLLNRR